MGYKIGSFNLRNLGLAAMGNGNSRNLRTIATIIRDEGFDVVALQEVLSQGKAFMSEDYAKNKKVSVNFYCRGGQYFDTYLLNNAKAVQKCNITQNNIIAILDDRSIRGQDLILTTSSITLLEGKRYKGTIPYVAVKAYREKDGIAFGKSVFRNPSVDVDALNELINELAAIQEKYKPKSKDDKLASIIQCIRQTIQMYPPSYQKYVGKTAPTNVGSCSNNAGKAEILQTETSQYRLNNSQQTQHIIRVRSYLSVSDPTRIQIEGELLDGWITVGAYCRLEDDEQVYQVAAIGYSTRWNSEYPADWDGS